MFENNAVVLDGGVYVLNLSSLKEEDYNEVFEYDKLYIMGSFTSSDIRAFVNGVIRHIIIDERFKDCQVSFFKDTRDKRVATPKQVRFIGAILENNYGYVLENNQKRFLERQSRSVIQRIIDAFKGTEFIY